MTDDPITVLHVDDDAPFRDLARTYLERSDSSFSIISEPSASDGLEQLERRTIDCIVSDYEMDDIDGLEFLEAVRDEYASLPFVLYTGRGSEEIAAKAVNAGADAYYQKEVGSGQYAVLAKHINTLVEKYRAERRLDYLERETHIVDGGTTVDENHTVDNSEPVSMAVVKAVAAREGVDPVVLTPPLADVVDPHAVDALFADESAESDEGAESLTLTYRGYTITVFQDGRVVLDG